MEKQNSIKKAFAYLARVLTQPLKNSPHTNIINQRYMPKTMDEYHKSGTPKNRTSRPKRRYHRQK